MTNRKILYGYQIQNGEIVVLDQEAKTVKMVFHSYLKGLSYLKISEHLNSEGIPFSAEAPLWNKHKVKRLLENSRYLGKDGYPPIMETAIFQAVQRLIREKTGGHIRKEKQLPPRTLASPDESIGIYIPSGEVIRLTNAINRGLEHPESPEAVVDLILQGISARYDCISGYNRPARAE